MFEAGCRNGACRVDHEQESDERHLSLPTWSIYAALKFTFRTEEVVLQVYVVHKQTRKRERFENRYGNKATIKAPMAKISTDARIARRRAGMQAQDCMYGFRDHKRTSSAPFVRIVSLLLLTLLTLLLLLTRTLALLRTRRVIAPTTPRCARHAVEWRAWGGGVRDGHARVGVEGHELGLGRLERGAEGGVLDAELIDDRAALLPAAVGLVGGGERGVE